MPQYYMLNKPSGCLTAKRDATRDTVMRFFPPEIAEKLHPVGRLDKDTEGLLLLTDDGYLDRFVLRPEHHLEKEYLFYAFGKLDRGCFEQMERGVTLRGSNAVSKPAHAQLLKFTTVGACESLLPETRKSHFMKNPDRPVTVGLLRITEGRKHQVKLMVSAVGGHVFALKRLAVGNLRLDGSLAPGAYRPLTERELRENLGYGEEHMTKYKTVLFDLDGTLADTLTDLRNAVNAALESENLPQRTAVEIRSFVGNGIRKLTDRSLPDGTSEEISDRVFARFREEYRAHYLDSTAAYPGIPELLRQLRAAGLKIAVISNKVQQMAQGVCDRLFPGLIDAVIGETELMPKKPAPDMALAVLERIETARTEALYVGDSAVDVQTAAAAGIEGLFVLWGFQDEAALRNAGARQFAGSPGDILKHILK